MLRRDKTRQISIRLDPDSYEKLKARSVQTGFGVYEIARELLELAIDDECRVLPDAHPWAVEMTKRTHDEMVDALLADVNHLVKL